MWLLSYHPHQHAHTSRNISSASINCPLPYIRSSTTQSLQVYIIAVMAGTLFCLFLIFLGLSHLLCLKAVPITRTESLMQVPKVHLVPENKLEVIAMENMLRKEESSIRERMDLELHDYSPYGANPRHTPRGA